MKQYRIYFLCLLSIVVGVFLTSCQFFEKAAEKSTPPNVVLIVVDTLAAKHMSVYDKSLRSTPYLQEIAKDAVVFERAYSAAPWTKPSIASLFTSVYPSDHTVLKLNHKLPEKMLTIADILDTSGYASYGVVSHTLLKEGSGYEQGFDHYKIIPFTGNIHNAIVGKTVSDFALKRITSWQENRKEMPLFLFLHYFDPHFNYQHHEQYDRTSWYKGKLKSGMGFRRLRNFIPRMSTLDKKYLVDIYREEIEYTDHHIGRVIEDLKKRSMLENTIIVITADHGEEFLEHGGLGHTRTLYDELIRVPLMVYWKGHLKGQRVEEAVSTMDVLPSVLKMIGKEKLPAHFSGVSFYENGKVKATERREIFSEVDFKSSGITAKKTGVVRDEFKFFEDHLEETEHLFNLDTDPEETKDIVKKETETASDLKLFVDEYRESHSGDQGEGLTHTEEELEELKSLGYL